MTEQDARSTKLKNMWNAKCINKTLKKCNTNIKSILVTMKTWNVTYVRLQTLCILLYTVVFDFKRFLINSCTKEFGK